LEVRWRLLLGVDMLEAALDSGGWIGGAKVHGLVDFRLEIRQVLKTMLFNTDALLIDLFVGGL
jgi:hypothetical protein